MEKSTLEAFSPPYLFRGIRPKIKTLNQTKYTRGEFIEFEIKKTNAPRSAVLISLSANTHFMDSGNNRYLDLSFTQTGSVIRAKLPSEPIQLPLGFYMLSVLVDDIPSVARMIQIGDKNITNTILQNKRVRQNSKWHFNLLGRKKNAASFRL